MRRLLLLLTGVTVLTMGCGNSNTEETSSPANPFASYCNTDPEAPGTSLSPDQDKVFIYMRHGARTLDEGSQVPFSNFPNSTCDSVLPSGFAPPNRDFAYQGYNFSAAQRGSISWDLWDAASGLNPGQCPPGWLTPGGWTQTESVGSKFGKQWQQTLAGQTSPTTWTIRSDDTPRVEETTVTFVGQAYEALQEDKDLDTSIQIWPETSYPNVSVNSSKYCPNFYAPEGQPDTNGLQSAGMLLDYGKTVQDRWDVISKYLQANDSCNEKDCLSPKASLNEWLYEGFYGLATAACPNTDTGTEGLQALPAEYQDEEFINAFLSFAPYSQFLPFYIFPEATTQPMLELLKKDLDNPDRPISLNFGHDWGPMLPLLGLLEADLGDTPIDYWPSFASTLTIGVNFEEGTEQQEGSVEIDYRGQPLKTKHCDSAGSGRCSLSDFRKFLDDMTSSSSKALGERLSTAASGTEMVDLVRGRDRTKTWASRFADMTREPVQDFTNS